ncbi:OmpA family protein [Sphingobacterium spiritivorum]|uniref:OmpA family protein n=1 Tax=Sphingobacterium spiritivorum TaxID=258 RepID=UPI0019185C4A|nr:OmpA family protein [Sphingobacterium spiritivorum]QQT25011.1 OmpA family protein [Sphingobacterium spiritivorum]
MGNKLHTIYKLLITGILLTGVIAVRGQEQVSLRGTADKLYHQYEYYRAARIYEKLVDTKKPHVQDMERLAECYYLMDDYSLAQNWYARIMNEGKFSDRSQLAYAELLKKTGNYAGAKEQFHQYAMRTGKTNEVALAIQGADSATVWMTTPTLHKLINEEDINTRNSEFGVTPLHTNVLYTGEPGSWSEGISGRTGRPYLKVYSASIDKNQLKLSHPAILPDVFNDAAFHVGPVAVSKDGNLLLVTRTYPGKDAEKQQAGNYTFYKHNLELIIYTRSGDTWSAAPFSYNNIQRYSTGHAALSEDESTLYFASDMPGGIGGVDIWFCPRNSDGSWDQPVNAGPEVNSTGDEMFPSVSGNMLYYSSNGFPGMGGLDIFVTEIKENGFSKSRNLRFPVNSASDDFSYVIVSKNNEYFSGYISSNRIGGKGLDDIYSFSFQKPKIQIYLEGQTLNKATSELIASVQLTLQNERGQIIQSKSSNQKGEFNFQADPGLSYRIIGEKVGFMEDSIAFTTPLPHRDTSIRLTLHLQPVMEKGTSFVMENIYYDLDKYNIRDDAKPILNQLVRTMRDNPGLKVELSSHTDSRATAKYNMKLSQNRAQSAVDYIVSRGIDRNRLIAKGYGETKLVNRCKDGVNCTEAQHQANRRTEIKILEY